MTSSVIDEIYAQKAVIECVHQDHIRDSTVRSSSLSCEAMFSLKDGKIHLYICGFPLRFERLSVQPVQLRPVKGASVRLCGTRCAAAFFYIRCQKITKFINHIGPIGDHVPLLADIRIQIKQLDRRASSWFVIGLWIAPPARPGTHLELPPSFSNRKRSIYRRMNRRLP